MRTIVEWAPREFNKEADKLAKGFFDSFDPAKRIPVSAQSLSWSILPDAPEAEKGVERAYLKVKAWGGLPDRWNVESRLKITDPR